MKLKLLFTFLLLALLQTNGFGQTTQTFNYTGAAQNFIVPAGVTSVKVEAWGGGAGGNRNVNRAGGGGAFAGNNTLAVTSGATYTITVGGGGAAGDPGQDSRFGNLVIAKGGIVGTGGSGNASTGTIIFNGGNGGASSGNGGSGGGGAGGNAAAGVNGTGSASGNNSGRPGGAGGTVGGGKGGDGGNSNSSGNDGAVPGGGGGERGSNGALSGAGGNGRVIISWTCPTFSLTSTEVTTPICTGSTTLVTLKNTTVANLPVGTYTVTYNLTGANVATARTATMTVATVGTGTFTTTALANNGSTTITITQLQSSGCTSAISTNSTATIVTTNSIIPTTQAGVTQTFCIDNGVSYTTPNAIAGQYALINVIKGFKYTFSVGNAFASFDENLTILEASTNANVAPATSATGASGVTITDWPCSLSGQIKVVLSAVGCNTNGTAGTSGITVTQTAIGNTQETQNEFGINTWVGHIYNSTGARPGGSPSPTTLSTSTTPFVTSNYAGNYTVATETINENFGSSTACIPVFSNGVQRASMYAGTFAVRYKMRTTKSGCYLVNITGDDGVRLYLNNSIVIDKWVEQSSTIYNNVLVNLNGNDDFVLDYYENAGQNVVGLTITPFDDASKNTVTPSSSNYCGGPAVILNGTDYLVNGQANPYLTFQWESSSNNSTWTNTGITTEDYSVSPTTTTYYRRVVKAIIGSCSVTSNSVVVNSAPVIITQPSTPAATCSGSGTQSMTVAAAGTGLTYDWQLGGVSVVNGGVISGQGTATLTLTNPTAANAGSYTVVVSGTCTPSVTSTARTVTVNTAPAITTQPSTPTATCSGSGTQSMTVAATGTGLTYDWQLGGVSVVNGAIISGQGTATLTLTNPTAANAGSYTVVVSGTCTPSVTSTARTVTVNPLPNNVTNGFSATIMCAGGSPQLTFDADDSTFTLAGYSITYKNETNLQSYTVSIGTSTPFTFPAGGSPTANTGYTLVSITNGNGCTNSIVASFLDSGANLIVRPTPTLTGATQPTFACDGSGATIDLSGLLASSTSTITYTINGGSTQTVTGLVADGSGAASFTTGVLATGNDGQILQITGITTTSATPNCTAGFTQNVTLSVKSDSGGISLNGVSYASNTTTTYCASNTAVFSITPVTGAASYIWSYPADWVAVGSQVGSTITLTTGATSGTVSVRADNLFCPSYLGVTLSTIPLSAPVFSKTDATCAVPTGTITVTSPAPAAGTVFTVTGTAPAVPSVTNTTGVFSGLTAGNYIVTYQQGSGCVSTSTAAISIAPLVTNTWNGAWSTGSAPTSNELVVFDADYSITTTALNACSCTINSGKNIVVGVPGAVNADAILKIENELVVLGSGKITFENNASLVQVNNASINSGNIHYKRTTSAVDDFDYVYWSSPVANQTLEALSPGSDKYWSWGIDNWAPASGVMAKGEGYIARVPRYTSPQKVEFIGEPFNGSVTVLSKGDTKGNLVGNPYPSAVDAKKFIAANIDFITGTLYFWTHVGKRTLNGTGTQYEYSSNDYASFNSSGGTEAVNGGKPDGNIAAGQSFFIIGTGGGNLVFNNSMRIGASGSNSLFFKQANTKKTQNTERHRVWLNLTNEGGAFKQLLVGYITGATNDFDKLFDGPAFNGNTYVDFYSINESKNYTIQGRGLPFDKEDEVPLGYKTTVEGTFQISIDEVDGDLVNQTVYLEDKTANVIHDLTKGSYSFTTAKGEFKDRFVLRYTNTSKLGTGDFDPKGKGVIVSVNKSQIKINSFDKTISSVKVYDLKGSLLYEKSKVDKNEFVIDHFPSSTQFMIVMVQLEDGNWVSEEIIFHD